MLKFHDDEWGEYDAGDLVNVPHIYLDGGWPGYPSETARAMARSLPYSMLARYKWIVGDSILPDPAAMREAISATRHAVTDQTVLDLMELASEERTLVVHMRTGDFVLIYGMDDEFTAYVKALSAGFSHVLILTGINNGCPDTTPADTLNAAYEHVDRVMAAIPGARLIVHGTPDDHLSVMSVARHLVLHRGGYSMLAGILNAGNHVYMSDTAWWSDMDRGDKLAPHLHPETTLHRGT